MTTHGDYLRTAAMLGLARRSSQTRIIVDAGGEYAPDAYIVCRIRTDGSWDPHDEQNTRVLADDWQVPPIATAYGWVPCPRCHETDGTVTCPHRAADDMMVDARAYMDRVVEAGCPIIDDPGYFG